MNHSPDDQVWGEPFVIPAPRRRKIRSMAFGAVFSLVGVITAIWIVIEHDRRPISACAAVTSTMLERALGTAVYPVTASPPDGGVPGATMCQYRTDSGSSATVFAFRQDADHYYAQTLKTDASHGVEPAVVIRPGYQAFVVSEGAGPGGRMQTLVLVKNGQYVNVNLYGAPAGAAAKLAKSTAANLA